MAQLQRTSVVAAMAVVVLLLASPSWVGPARGEVSGGLAHGRLMAAATPAALAEPGGLTPVVASATDEFAPLGNACIFPPKNTLGFTCSGPNVFEWKWDTGGAFDIEVDMGELANFDKVSGSQKYKMQLVNLNAVAWFWYDANGQYNPVTDPNCSDGGRYYCDDPRLAPEPWDIFKIKINGQDFVTQQGHNNMIFSEWERYFEFKPIGSDPPGTYRVPEGMLHSGINTVTIEPVDSYPQYENGQHMRFHQQAADGWEINVPAIQIQLVAPPLFISHGWGFNWNEPVRRAGWQEPLATAIRNTAGQAFAQDAWKWAEERDSEYKGTFLNFYDSKQNWRRSAIQLGDNVNAYAQQLGYSGKVWLTGHSMGGIVSRSYTEEFGGRSKVEEIATFDTPHMGSPFADFYTRASWDSYKGLDGKLTAEYVGVNIGSPNVGVGPFGVRSTPLAGFLYWRDWWNPGIGAYSYQYFGVGRDHLADFGIKPSGVNEVFKDPVTGLFTIHTMSSNRMLDELNARYPASGVEYFAVVGIATGLKDTALEILLQTIGQQGYFRGDVIVPDFSENLNGRIESREVSPATHLDVMKNADAIRYVVRALFDLDLDTGDDPNAPGFAAPTAQPTPTSAASATVSPTALAMETTEGALTFVRRTDLVDGVWTQPITIDASIAEANFTVWTRADMGPLVVTLVDPTGTEWTSHIGVSDRSFMYGESRDLPAKIRTYYVQAPEHGTWTLRVRPVDDVPTEGIPLYATAFVSSPVSLVAGAGAQRYRAGETAALRAVVLTDGAPTPGATVRALYLDAEGEEQALSLFDDGAHDDVAANDGMYGASLVLPAADGELQVLIEAAGGSGANAFLRAKTIPLFVASLPDLAILPGGLSATPAQPWGGDDVTATVVVKSLGERAVNGAIVMLEDAGEVVATASTTDVIPVGGERSFTMSFPAPLHALTLTARIVPLDVDADRTNDAASIVVDNVPLARTVATVSGPQGAGDWYTGAVGVALESAGMVESSLDGAPFAAYAGPFVVASDGRHTLDFRASDGLGHTEPVRSVAFGIDATAPTVLLASPARGTVSTLVVSLDDTLGYTLVAGLVQLDVPAADPTSGLARLDVLVDGKVVASTTEATASGFEYLWDSTTASMGNHLLTVRVTNGAGLSASASQHVYVLVSRTLEVERNPNDMVARLRPEAG